MSEVLSKVSCDYKFLYFTCSHDWEFHIGEQNHQNQKLSAGADMDFKADLIGSLLNVRSRERVGGRDLRTISTVYQIFLKSFAPNTR